MKKYNNLLFFLGIFLITVGIVMSLIVGNWSNLSLGITIVGIGIIVATIVIFLYTNQGFWAMRSTEAGTNALISTIAFIAILGLINFLAVKYSYRVDLTETKLYTLSPQSQELVKNLAQPMKVYVFSTPANPSTDNLLANYARYSSNFDYQFVDPDVKLNLAEKFGVERSGDVYLEYADKQQLVQIVSPNSPLSEINLTNAIAKIQRTEQPIVYILQGHGEPSFQETAISFSNAIANLQEIGYIVKPLNLTQSPLVPPDADALVITSGDRGLLTGEVETLTKYVNNGGNLLVMYNADSEVSIDNLLNQWGVSFAEGLVIDASGTGEVFGLGPSTTFVVNYGSHPITGDFGNGITIFPWARAIITESVETITTTPILITNAQTWSESNIETEEVQLDSEEDIAGPLNLGLALVKENLVTQENSQENNNQTPSQPTSLDNQQPETNSSTESPTNQQLPPPPTIKNPDNNFVDNTVANKSDSTTKMVVIGNANFATNGWFQQQLNSDLFLNAIAWLADEEAQTLSISPKEPTNRRLNLNLFQVGLIGWLAILIIPVLGIGTAIFTWWRRSR